MIKCVFNIILMMFDSCCCTLERELVAIRKKGMIIPAVFDPSVYKDEGQSRVLFLRMHVY